MTKPSDRGKRPPFPPLTIDDTIHPVLTLDDSWFGAAPADLFGDSRSHHGITAASGTLMSITTASSTTAGPVLIPIVLRVIGPNVPASIDATAVELSARSITVQSESPLPWGHVVALAFALPARHPSTSIVAITSIESESRLSGDGWRTDLQFEELSRADSERVASILVQGQFHREPQSSDAAGLRGRG
jgi:hypothetical protein